MTREGYKGICGLMVLAGVFGLWLVPRPEILDACGWVSCFESLGRGVAAGVDVPCWRRARGRVNGCAVGTMVGARVGACD